MPHTIEQRVRRWSSVVGAEIDYQEIYLFLVYLSEKLYHEYSPTCGASLDFLTRLRNWLNQVPDEEDQKTLLRIVPNVFFCGRDEFNALCRAAFNGPIVRWLVDDAGLSVVDPDISSKIWDVVKRTWFCGLTDSMQIAEFYHVNHISGRDYRADMRSLHGLGGDVVRKEVVEYLEDEGIQRIVLLEDFVGSGSQIDDTIEFAASLSDKIKILVVPLLLCPEGLAQGILWEKRFPNVRFDPVILLPPRVFIKPTKQDEEIDSELYARIRELVVRLYNCVKGGDIPDAMVNLYGPFGYHNTGGVVVNYANCPDNTLPVIHHESRTWKPIFPRSSRI